MVDSPTAFDDRESFLAAQATLAAIRHRCEQSSSEDEVWESFIQWRGSADADYLRRIREGRKFIFYSLLQELFRFGEESCGEDVTPYAGAFLTRELLRVHIPDLLQAIIGSQGRLAEQILWLVNRFVMGTANDVYALEVLSEPDDPTLSMTLSYRHEREMSEYLEKRGLVPEAAFTKSMNMVEGAFSLLADKTIHGFAPGQLKVKRQGLHTRFDLTLSEENRFNFEGVIEILLDYVAQLREQGARGAPGPVEQDALCQSPAMARVWKSMIKVGSSRETVLLCGESGTGKSFYARKMHELGARKEGPFIEVGLTSEVGTDNLIQSNLFGHVRGAFTGAQEEKRGLFSLADGGTIFLDEVGDASLELQAKLLRVLETRKFKMLGGVEDLSVDVSIIAATNRDLEGDVKAGRFREDLFYRLNVIRIDLPPLRNRIQDLPALVERLFAKVVEETQQHDKTLSPKTLDALFAYSWPGNVRELENALRYAVAMSEGAEIQALDLPEGVHEQADFPRSESAVVDRSALQKALASPEAGAESWQWPGHVDYARREYLRALIEHYRGNLPSMARHWDRSSENTLRKLIREFDLEEELRSARKSLEEDS